MFFLLTRDYIIACSTVYGIRSGLMSENDGLRREIACLRTENQGLRTKRQKSDRPSPVFQY